MTRRLSEAQAWRRIAEQVDAGGYPPFLCVRLDQMYKPRYDSVCNDPVYWRAKERIAEYLVDAATSAYSADTSREDACGGRVLAALWLALDAEAEARQARRQRAAR